MLRLEKRTSLSPEKTVEALKRFFGKGGLLKTCDIPSNDYARRGRKYLKLHSLWRWINNPHQIIRQNHRMD